MMPISFCYCVNIFISYFKFTLAPKSYFSTCDTNFVLYHISSTLLHLPCTSPDFQMPSPVKLYCPISHIKNDSTISDAAISLNFITELLSVPHLHEVTQNLTHIYLYHRSRLGLIISQSHVHHSC